MSFHTVKFKCNCVSVAAQLYYQGLSWQQADTTYSYRWLPLQRSKIRCCRLSINLLHLCIATIHIPGLSIIYYNRLSDHLFNSSTICIKPATALNKTFLNYSHNTSFNTVMKWHVWETLGVKHVCIRLKSEYIYMAISHNSYSSTLTTTYTRNLS